jgi:hypothetical protein
MSFTYRYTGPAPTAFITIRHRDQTWVPDPGDEVTLDYEVAHPWLELVGAQNDAPEVVEETTVEEAVVVTEPPVTRRPRKAVAADSEDDGEAP